jgi:hypothetical protein
MFRAYWFLSELMLQMPFRSSSAMYLPMIRGTYPTLGLGLFALPDSVLSCDPLPGSRTQTI